VRPPGPRRPGFFLGPEEAAHYGPAFGKGCGDNERLSDVLKKIDEGSLSELVTDDEGGKLEQVRRINL
jgi:hypothetical protein